MNNAIYAGTFDPMTKGHLEVLKESARLFDKVYLVFATNYKKSRDYDTLQMISAVTADLQELNLYNVIVLGYCGFVGDLAESLDNVPYLIRGLRSVNDYTYEENIADINKELYPNLTTVYLRGNSKITSSSLVKEMHLHHKDISKYVSENVLNLMNKEEGKQ